MKQNPLHPKGRKPLSQIFLFREKPNSFNLQSLFHQGFNPSCLNKDNDPFIRELIFFNILYFTFCNDLEEYLYSDEYLYQHIFTKFPFRYFRKRNLFNMYFKTISYALYSSISLIGNKLNLLFPLINNVSIHQDPVGYFQLIFPNYHFPEFE